MMTGGAFGMKSLLPTATLLARQGQGQLQLQQQTVTRRTRTTRTTTTSTGVGLSLNHLREQGLFELDSVTGRIFKKQTKTRPSKQQQPPPPKPTQQQQPLFQIIVGLEIHAQLDIPTKLFSPAATNTNTEHNAWSDATSLSSLSSFTNNKNNKNNKNNNTSTPSSSNSSSSVGLSSLKLRPNSAMTTNTTMDTSCPISAMTATALHPLDVAVPGYLPVLVSKLAVQKAVLAAALFHCDIPSVSRFERKHYTYADLPSHYQVTQQRWPLAINGWLNATVNFPKQMQQQQKQQQKQSKLQPYTVTCRLHRIQLEQDTGKTINTTYTNLTSQPKGKTITTTQYSCVDFNRAGQALVEIVLAPDLRTPHEAATITETIRQLLKHIGVCNGRMEEGSFRCDVNVNLEEIICIQDEQQEQEQHDQNDNDEKNNNDKNNKDRNGNKLFSQQQQQQQTNRRKRSPRVEVKNLNSIRQVREAVEYEALRQAQIWWEEESKFHFEQEQQEQDNKNQTNSTSTTNMIALVGMESSKQGQLDMDNWQHDDKEKKKECHEITTTTTTTTTTTPLSVVVPTASETRMWNPSTKRTELIRIKDMEDDYRFLPEPDLPPLILYNDDNDDDNEQVNHENVTHKDHSDDNKAGSYTTITNHDANSRFLLLDGMDVSTFVQTYMPELPDQAILRLQNIYGLTEYQATVIARDPPAIAFLDHAIVVATAQTVANQQDQDGYETESSIPTSHTPSSSSNGASTKSTVCPNIHRCEIAILAANLMINTLFALVKEHSSSSSTSNKSNKNNNNASSSTTPSEESWDQTTSIHDSQVSSEQLGQIVALLYNRTLSKFMSQNLLRLLYTEIQGGIPAEVAQARGWKLIRNPHVIRDLCRDIVTKQPPDKLEKYAKGGKLQTKLLKYFAGQVMEACHGNADPELMRHILQQVLEEESSGNAIRNDNDDKNNINNNRDDSVTKKK